MSPAMASKLTTNQKIALYGPILAVVLTALVAWFSYQWTKPFLHFEEGQYYRTGDVVVSALKLQNAGHSDVEEIVVHSVFPGNLSDLTLSDPTVPLTVKTGGKGSDFVVFGLP